MFHSPIRGFSDETSTPAVAEPWLRKDARLLEIGPGGGKWTVRLAPQVKDVVAFDVADTMLERTRARCAREDVATARIHPAGTRIRA